MFPTSHPIPFNQNRTFPSAIKLLGLVLFANIWACSTSYDTDFYNDLEDQRIQPYLQNPWYWQYKGEPVLLLGGSNEDNLFNHPDLNPDGLEAHLDDMVSITRDSSSPVRLYVRNTMSSRDGGQNVWWFNKDDDTGLYDLDAFNTEYWQRFDDFLAMTAERDIIVQIELWDRFDFAQSAWDDNPFNPDNNINYSSGEIDLPTDIDSHPGELENPFFRSVPDLEDNAPLLQYQESVALKVLEISLKYDHVLYTISNETSESPLWSKYWAQLLRQTADQAGKKIEVTEMWDDWDLTDKEHANTFDHPELYSFVDISQNGHQDEQVHWDNMQKARDLLSVQPRPMNTVKIYGADNGKHHGTSEEEATRRLWRNIFGGLASSRFHRPPHGIGLDDIAKTHLRSADMFVQEIDIFKAEPDNSLLSGRSDDEAYSISGPDSKYAVYFTDGGSVDLEVDESGDSYTLHWFNIIDSEWEEPETGQYSSEISLTPPDDGQWVALVQIGNS